MARIIYEGDARAMDGGGDLFGGFKFFFTQRVPQRARWEGLVKANGGQLVALDVAADFVIADHLRPNTPAGSISWKFVEVSIKNGRLQETDDYIRPQQIQRTVGRNSSGPRAVPKIGRTAFTAQEDLLFSRWCRRQERRGCAMGGNVVYQEYARENPRHTLQSWRDRWVKILQFRTPAESDDEHIDQQPNANLETEEENAQERPSLPRTDPKPRPQRSTVVRQQPRSNLPSIPNTQSRVRTPVQAIDSVDRVPIKSETSTPQSSNHFSQRDIALLLNEYDAIMNLDEDKTIDAWITWAEQYSNHSAQEWSNYFHKAIRGKVNTTKQVHNPTESHADATTPSRSVRRSPRTHSPLDSPSAQLLMSMQAEEDTALAVTKLPNRQTPAIEVQKSRKSSNPTTAFPLQQMLDRSSPKVRSDEERFNDNLMDLAANFPQPFEIDLQPTILGVRITLYSLFQEITSDTFDSAANIDEHDQWSEVAGALGFDHSMCDEAGLALRNCYMSFLNEYYACCHKEAVQKLSQADQSAEVQPISDHDDDRSSVTSNRSAQASPEHQDVTVTDSEEQLSNAVSRKRSSSNDLPIMNGKKACRDKGKGRLLEIPSTPETMMVLSHKGSAVNPSPLRNSNSQMQPQQKGKGSQNEEEDVWAHATASPTPTRSGMRPNSSMAGISSGLKMRANAIHHERGSTSSAPPTRQPPAMTQSRFKPATVERRISDNSVSSQSQNSSVKKTQSGAQSKPVKPALAEFKERCSGLGYSETIQTKALWATSLNIGGLATRVMESLRNNHGIPDDIPGVWTELDDKNVKIWDAARKAGDRPLAKQTFDRLAAKHTRNRIKPRKKWLVEMS